MLAEDDTVIGEAPTTSQEARPARRLVLVGGRSGREGVESRQPERDLSGHVDADGDSAVSDGGPDSVGGVSSASEAEEIEVPVVVGVPPVRPSVAAQRAGFGQLDLWDISEVFSCRASVMRTVPRFLWGSFRVALKVALEEIRVGHSTRNTQRQERGWKLFLLLLRKLLHRSPRGGPISRDKLIGRFDQFAAGHWGDLIDASHKCTQEAVTAFRRRQRRSTDPDAHRARRALQFVQLGELSSGRQALEGAELALGNRNTLDKLRQ